LNAEFTAAGARVLGISRDDSKSHAKFAEKFSLNFPLLADTETTTCQAYGVWVEKMNYGKKYLGIERTTFVIDAEGKIARIFPKVKVEGHADQVLEAIRAL
jgi:thioredoxin-dependent peroxiredoxin